MPLARAHRITIARVLSWSRRNGWVHDIYPNTWRSTDGLSHVRYDTVDQTLVVDHLVCDGSPPRWRVALIPVDSVDVAVNVLAALGRIPLGLCHSETFFYHDPPEPPPIYKELAWSNGEPQAWDVDEQQPLPGMPPAPEPDEFDGPASFSDAGQALADLIDGLISADRAAELLSRLARDGLIVSTTYHDEMLSQLTDYAISDPDTGGLR